MILAGCVERGDFGRVKWSVWNEAVTRTGTLAAAARGEPVSFNPLTDDEEALRGRAWRYLVPGRDRPWFDRTLAELVATRVIPPDAIEPDRHAYHRGLLADAGRSPASLYRRLSEDASADTRLVEPFVAVALRVLAADRIRISALRRVREVNAGDAAEAWGRVGENRCLIAWVTAASTFRLAAYRYALDHLVIETPMPDAVPTERVIGHFAAERTRLDRLDALPLSACTGDAAVGVTAPQSAPPESPLVRKG